MAPDLSQTDTEQYLPPDENYFCDLAAQEELRKAITSFSAYCNYISKLSLEELREARQYLHFKDEVEFRQRIQALENEISYRIQDEERNYKSDNSKLTTRIKWWTAVSAIGTLFAAIISSCQYKHTNNKDQLEQSAIKSLELKTADHDAIISNLNLQISDLINKLNEYKAMKPTPSTQSDFNEE